MAGPFFQKSSWPPFTYHDKTYDLSHLDEQLIAVEGQGGVERVIAITFSDHCFTRNLETEDAPYLIYPGSSRSPGCFCFDRYTCSLNIAEHISIAANGKVWLMQGNNFAVIPFTDALGARVHYGIFFSLDRVKGIEQVDLHMRIKSAYPFTLKRPTTYGNTRFRVLVDLRMKDKYPGLNTSQHRRW